LLVILAGLHRKVRRLHFGVNRWSLAERRRGVFSSL
jgi:hypothetical protein